MRHNRLSASDLAHLEGNLNGVVLAREGVQKTGESRLLAEPDGWHWPLLRAKECGIEAHALLLNRLEIRKPLARAEDDDYEYGYEPDLRPKTF